MKQINFDSKSMGNENSIKRLIHFVHHLEEKLLSVKIVHERLDQLMTIVSKTHESILLDLNNIKTFLNQQDEDDYEVIPIDPTKSEWDDDDDDEEEEINRQRVVNRPQSATKRPSSLKKSSPISSSIKSPKSVTFNIDENLSNEQPKKFISTFQIPAKEKRNSTFNELTTPVIPSDDFKQNQSDKIPKVLKTLTNIRIHEIESKNGDYIRLLNVSNSDDYDLSEHFLQQNIHAKLFCRFRFPINTIIGPGQTLTVWCGRDKDIVPQPPYVFLWKEQAKWETRPECITILAKPNGQSIAWYKNCHRVVTDQSSSDILHVHTKTNPVPSDISSSSSSTATNVTVLYPTTKQHRLSSFKVFGNTKPPFAHSPNNPIHPDHSGTNGFVPNDLRSQINQKARVPQLLNRPKSSPFANHLGCKQDLISLNLLRIQKQKQTMVKN